MGAYELVQKLEQLRKKFNEQMMISVVLMLVLIFCMGVLGGVSGGVGAFFMFVIVGMVMVYMGISSSKVRREFKELYKNSFVKTVLGEFFENPVYLWDKGFDKEAVKSFGISLMGNTYSSEDYLAGEYKGVKFQQADVSIKQVTHSGKHTSTTIYFIGRMFVFQFPKNDLLPVQVFSDRFSYRGKPVEGWKMNKIKMEGVDFNKRFDVKAAREHDAFYVLTPQMMERLTFLEQRFGEVAFNFSGNVLYMGYKCDMNAFDANMSRPIDYSAEKDKIRGDIQVILDIIDTMELAQQ